MEKIMENKENVKPKLYKLFSYKEFLAIKDNIIVRDDFLKIGEVGEYYFNKAKKENPREFLLVDENTNNLLTYATLSDSLLSENVLHINFITTPNREIRGKGYASLMLDEICKYARSEGYQKVHLDGLGQEGRYLYYKKGFLPVERECINMVSMYKMLNQQDWAYSVVFNEAIKIAKKNNVRVGDALHYIVKNNAYDNMFQYVMFEENEYNNTKSEAKSKYIGWCNYFKRMYLEDPLIPVLSGIFDEGLKKGDLDFSKTLGKLAIEKNDISSVRQKLLTNKFENIKNVVDGVNLINDSNAYEEAQRQRQMLKKSSKTKNKLNRKNKSNANKDCVK